jgi:hypothetical protein
VWSGGDAVLVEELGGVDGVVGRSRLVGVDFEVEVGPAGVARGAHDADGLADGDVLADGDDGAYELVTVTGDQMAGMQDLEVPATAEYLG